MTLTQTLQHFDTARELEVDQAWRDLHAAIDSCRLAAHGGEYGSLPMLASAARVIRTCLATIEPVQEGDSPEWTYACRRAVLGAAIAYCWTSSALWTVDTLNQACSTALALCPNER